MKRKISLIFLDFLKIFGNVNFLIRKNKRHLTEEKSCFVILTNYLNERLRRHCKGGALIKYFSCEEGHLFERGVHSDWGALSDNYGKSSLGKALLFKNIYPAVYRKYSLHINSLSALVVC